MVPLISTNFVGVKFWILSVGTYLPLKKLFFFSKHCFFGDAGKLLSHVQFDSDPVRQSAVKKRIAQYISRAEQLGKEVFHLLFFQFNFIPFLFFVNF